MSDNTALSASSHEQTGEPEDKLNSTCDDEDNVPIKFSPPLYKQRYNKILDFLGKHAVRTVVDFGCAECKFLPMLKGVESVEKAYGVDIDETVLETHKHRLRPLIADFLCRRKRELAVELFCGSIADYDQRLSGVEAVVMIELIEHLACDTLASFPEVVFGKLHPQLCIITTPNSDFNELFNSTGFRHWDHKFEWTRKEFQQWCQGICDKYSYKVDYFGIGDPPEGRENLGHCSQGALFLSLTDKPHDSTDLVAQPYKLITETIFPGPKDDGASPETQLLQDAEYYIRMIVLQQKQQANDSDWNECHVPLSRILVFPKIKEFCDSEDVLRSVLESAGHIMTEDGRCVIYNPDDSKSSTSDEAMDNDICDNTDWTKRDPANPVPAGIATQMEDDWNDSEETAPEFEDVDSEDFSADVIMPTGYWALPPITNNALLQLNQFVPAYNHKLKLSYKDMAKRSRHNNYRYIQQGQFSDEESNG